MHVPRQLVEANRKKDAVQVQVPVVDGIEYFCPAKTKVE